MKLFLRVVFRLLRSILGKLTNPAFAVAYQLELEQQKAQTLSQSKQTSPNLPLRQAERLLMNSLSMLKRDGSEVSVSSLFNQVRFRCKSTIKQIEGLAQ